MSLPRPPEFKLTDENHDIYVKNEYLAHDLAYKEWFVDGLQLNLQNDIQQPYSVKSVKVPHQGLYCFILQPKPECKTKEIFILFRGTKCFYSLFRDFEPNAAGALSFASAIPYIIKEVNNTLDEIYSRDVKITVAGHSLGGADAQNCFLALMKEADTNRTSFHKVKRINLVAFSSAGITEEAAREADRFALSLKNKDVKLICHWLHAAGDLIQQTGQASILANATPDIAEVHLLKASLENAEFKSLLELLWLTDRINRTVQAHKRHYFKNTEQEKVTFEYYNNSTQEGQKIIQSKLSKKINFLQYFNFTYPQTAIAACRDYFGQAKLILENNKNKQLIHIKRELTLADILSNAASISIIFDPASSYPLPQLQIQLMPNVYPAYEQLDKALIPYNAPRVIEPDQLISILIPIMPNLFHDSNLGLAQNVDRIDIRIDHQDANLLPLIEEIKDEAAPHSDVQNTLVEKNNLIRNLTIVGALVGIVTAIALTVFFPPALVFVAAVLHISAPLLATSAIVSGVLSACGALLGTITGGMYRALTKIPASQRSLVADHPQPEENKAVPSNSLVQIHKQLDIKIENNSYVDDVNREVKYLNDIPVTPPAQQLDPILYVSQPNTRPFS